MKQRIAIVTGSCRGIGYAIAEELSSKGMDLAMLDIDGDKLKAAALELKKKSSVEILPVVVDLSDAEMLKRACVDVRGKFGSVDTIVNVAGVAWGTEFEAISVSEWDKVFDINLKAGFLLTQEFIGDMCKNGFGRLISISSMAGVMGSENAGCHYCASKAAVIGFVKYLSKRYAKYGITANAVAPGPIESEMVRGLGEETYQNLLDSMPTHKLGRPDQIAAVVELLASERGGFITGTVIEASGGQIIV